MEKLLEALSRVQKLQTERDKAFADCDHSWGYYGYDMEDKLKTAQSEFAVALKEVINAEIGDKLMLINTDKKGA